MRKEDITNVRQKREKLEVSTTPVEMKRFDSAEQAEAFAGDVPPPVIELPQGMTDEVRRVLEVSTQPDGLLNESLVPNARGPQMLMPGQLIGPGQETFVSIGDSPIMGYFVVFVPGTLSVSQPMRTEEQALIYIQAQMKKRQPCALMRIEKVFQP